jgi:tetratricopeptide (TPR) repeat protein
LGNIEFAAGHLEAAINAYRRVLDAGDSTFWPRASLAAAYALQGNMDESKDYVAETLRLNPNFTVKWLREHALDIPLRNEGLRKAGFKEE